MPYTTLENLELCLNCNLFSSLRFVEAIAFVIVANVVLLRSLTKQTNASRKYHSLTAFNTGRTYHSYTVNIKYIKSFRYIWFIIFIDNRLQNRFEMGQLQRKWWENVTHLEKANKHPFMEPKQDRETNMGTAVEKFPSTLSAKVCERERETDRQTDRQTAGERDSKRQREREREDGIVKTIRVEWQEVEHKVDIKRGINGPGRQAERERERQSETKRC